MLQVNTRSAIRWDRLMVLFSPFRVYDTVTYNKKAPRRRISFWKESQVMGPTLIYEDLASVGTTNFGIRRILQESEDFVVRTTTTDIYESLDKFEINSKKIVKSSN